MKPQIKICCISSKKEAKMAIEAGASAIGLVGKMPSGPGPIEDNLIKEIAIKVPPPIATFYLPVRLAGNAFLIIIEGLKPIPCKLWILPKMGPTNFYQKNYRT